VLDLDETLVHTTDKVVPLYDFRVEIHTRRAHRAFYILKRPFLDVFLVTLAQYFEIVIFTASIRRYAEAVIDIIDTHHVVERRYYRQSCIKNGTAFLKDLRIVNPDLRRVLLIDNSPVAYSLQEENGVPISTWYDDPNDTALRDLIPFLLAVRSLEDVRALLYRRVRLQRLAELEDQQAELQEEEAAAVTGAEGGNSPGPVGLRINPEPSPTSAYRLNAQLQPSPRRLRPISVVEEEEEEEKGEEEEEEGLESMKEHPDPEPPLSLKRKLSDPNLSRIVEVAAAAAAAAAKPGQGAEQQHTPQESTATQRKRNNMAEPSDRNGRRPSAPTSIEVTV
jgi:CTD nuclear envelope phosphatase 1